MAGERVTVDLAAHLANRYGVGVAQPVELDVGVFRVDRRDGSRWVARVFDTRGLADVEGDAAILRSLETAGFPAERCADADPVSLLADQPVLVTEWVDGVHADGRGRTFGVLGVLLGRLHARGAVSLRPGGAWHHLSQRGGPRAEIDAAIDRLESAERTVAPEQHARYDQVRDALEHLDDCADLPHAFVHPDPVPSNAIATPDDHRVLVDWTGAGNGPRLWPLALLLWAGGLRDLRLVDAAVTRYARDVRLEPAELDRLAAVIPARPLTMDVWSFSHGRIDLQEVLVRLRANRAIADRVSDRVREALDA